ncbi:uncharacterized protein EI90DRAFT_3013506 [Cantharellus anzutake]|uniref:uncharacterized protein n=1 Tax=Cantharellus anzutake TaxID=1750568 RepID=UPI0019077DB7|nr:uncharacterized protein EI90DRAFT_3013506 [Cantharellus anzutake]KAF8338227.1 hypothetical protein EI90DRAFT_3013506 [Cantharellus anzutake]
MPRLNWLFPYLVAIPTGGLVLQLRHGLGCKQEPLKEAMMERGPEYADSTREVGKVGEPTIIERPAHIKSKEENSGSIEAIEPKANNGSMVPRKEKLCTETWDESAPAKAGLIFNMCVHTVSTLKERIAALQANSGLTPPGNGSSRFSTPSPGPQRSPSEKVPTNRLSDKIARFDKLGRAPVPRSGFGLGSPPPPVPIP